MTQRQFTICLLKVYPFWIEEKNKSAILKMVKKGKREK